MGGALPVESHQAGAERAGEERIDDPCDPAWHHQREQGSTRIPQDRLGTAEPCDPDHVALSLVSDEKRLPRPVVSEAFDCLGPVPDSVLQRGSRRTTVEDVRRPWLDRDQQWRHAA